MTKLLVKRIAGAREIEARGLTVCPSLEDRTTFTHTQKVAGCSSGLDLSINH
jgi:hypothetical protein